ncbi:Phytochrome-like protein cph2 [compost metagenome]
MRQLGVRVALDDFGSGPCSLAHLRDIPFDTLKLDRHLLARVVDSPRDAALVRSVIELCRQFGVLVIAEGLESPAQYRWLVENGCPFGQGSLVARPLMAEDVGDFVQPFEWGALGS